MEHRYALTSPELFTLELEDGKTSRGARQEWYSDEWQQKAGCGPVTASTLLSYLSYTRPGLSALYPSGSRSKEDFVRFMETMWGYATPGKLGLNSLGLFTKGIISYTRDRQCTLYTRELDIPRFRIARPSFSQCAAFLRTGLSSDSPVAFLNFSSGKVPFLDSWHWVPIISMVEQSGGQTICTILDGGREREIDFQLWYQTSRVGGGLVYIPKECAT